MNYDRNFETYFLAHSVYVLLDPKAAAVYSKLHKYIRYCNL